MRVGLRRSENGFTLVELLVGVAILGIIGTTVTSALFVSIKTTTKDQVQLNQSNTEQLLATFLAKDIAAACDPSLSTPTCARNPNPSVSAGTACGTTVAFAMDILTDAFGGAADTTVGYALQSQRLTRVRCAVGASSAASTVSVASNVTNFTPSMPTTGACANQFMVAVTTAGGTSGTGYPPYDFTLCLHRRAG